MNSCLTFWMWVHTVVSVIVTGKRYLTYFYITKHKCKCSCLRVFKRFLVDHDWANLALRQLHLHYFVLLNLKLFNIPLANGNERHNNVTGQTTVNNMLWKYHWFIIEDGTKCFHHYVNRIINLLYLETASCKLNISSFFIFEIKIINEYSPLTIPTDCLRRIQTKINTYWIYW